MLSKGLDGTKFCKAALKINPRIGAARYLMATRYAFAPGLFRNLDKAIELLQENLSGAADLQKDDLFNTYRCLSYSYLKNGDKASSDAYYRLALSLYPTNTFLADELAGRTNVF
jgi:tetratricopeptide (TPR) repeat protein